MADKKKPIVICVANLKGGISKSSDVGALATILNERGYKTLVVDSDPQCNISDTYRCQIKDTGTLYDVLLDYEVPLPARDAIQHTESGDIIASDPELADCDLKVQRDGDEYFLLRDAISDLTEYDFIVLDTAPTDNIILKNCMTAADYVLIPITTDRYAIQGLSRLFRIILKQQKRNNQNLKIAGLLLVRFKQNQVLARQVRAELDSIVKEMGTKLFKTTIHENVAVQRAQAERVPLIKYDKNCQAAKDYEAFIDELLEDIL